MIMNNEAFVDLLSIDGLGQSRLAKLIDKLGSPSEILTASNTALKAAGIPEKIASKIASYTRTKKAAEALDKLNQINARIIALGDKNYPPLLAASPQPPAALFVRGKLDIDGILTIAIVGTRRATGYGRAAAEKLSRELAARGAVIVSGGARGIDTLAHKGCLAAGSRTIAVLGCGIDIAYPPENDELFERIATQGAVVSEFLPGVPPAPGLFPRRNRIIAWLSHGVVAVEAGVRSGALITARWAADAGRDVFAVPGNIFTAQASGTNQLLRDGAKLVSKTEDILEEYAALSQSSASVEDTLPVREIPTMTETEKRIYKLLDAEPTHVDNLVEKLGLSSGQLLPTLLAMELKGVIKQLPGMRFVRVL